MILCWQRICSCWLIKFLQNRPFIDPFCVCLSFYHFNSVSSIHLNFSRLLLIHRITLIIRKCGVLWTKSFQRTCTRVQIYYTKKEEKQIPAHKKKAFFTSQYNETKVGNPVAQVNLLISFRYFFFFFFCIFPFFFPK